jgi:hypothetical protein
MVYGSYYDYDGNNYSYRSDCSAVQGTDGYFGTYYFGVNGINFGSYTFIGD